MLLSFQCSCLAQSIKLIKSTDQSWSGGVAGRSGDNYNFVISCTGLSAAFIPDTLWIGEESLPLSNGDTIINGHVKITYSKNKTAAKIEVNARTEKDEYNMRNALPGAEKKASFHPPFAFKGAGLLGYRYKGRQHYFTIGRFTKIFPPINYP